MNRKYLRVRVRYVWPKNGKPIKGTTKVIARIQHSNRLAIKIIEK